MLHKLQNYDTTSFGREVMKADANSEKYSLRQRQRGRNQGGNISSNLSQNRSKLNRSRLDVSSAAWNKSKSKAAPLSKYRRKTANARERSRMREINLAFENLRRCVPSSIADEDIGFINEKLTKITTLRLAMKYIHKLTEALTDPNFNVDFLLEAKQGNNPLNGGELSTPSLSKRVAYTKESNLSKTKALHKRPTNKQYRKLEPSTRITPNSVMNSAHNSLSFSPNKLTKNVSSSLFDSDGESVHLSESCLSPVNDTSENSKKLSDNHCGSNQNPFNRITRYDYSETPALQNPLEISFCLFDQTNETLDWENVQHRTTCNSPFPALDSFSSINELLHHDLMDHNSLDLFLT